MDFQDARWRGRYEKLSSGEEKAAAARTRRLWLKKLSRRGKGLKLSRSRRKLNWKPFSIMLMLSRKIARKYVDFVKRLKMDEACPAIVFSFQWGLPVLSHQREIPISNCKNLTWL
ncbi:hypothetical protein C2S53_000963 [Perilla frutescens var. hirtella]|uniref:Uncharacterized protein n=1 Tax=Perilla frutescens var. hirtella TaxID=608512 RepID=A0AAD4JQS9_PERFH|nr:hypothetical protein C2S53_000963 [Perilla frutescens var. hirtella]